MAYRSPAVVLNVQSRINPAAIDLALRPMIVGGHAQLMRYDDADVKEDLLVGQYVGDEQAYLWPDREAGAKVDQSYAKVFFEDAKVILFSDLIDADELVAPVGGNYKNRIRRAGSGGFVENTDTYPRITTLYDRDVRAGDRVRVRGVVDDENVELITSVLSITGDTVAASIASATSDDDNLADQSEDITITQTAGSVTLTLAARLDSYNGYIDGYINETYTVSVTQGSVGGDLTTAILKVVSASGADSDASVVPAAVSTYFEIGERHAELRFTGSGDLVAGQTWTVEIEADFDEVFAVSDGTYTGTEDLLYVIEVEDGGLFAEPDALPTIRVRTTTGVDSSTGAVEVAAAGTAVACGTLGVTVRFGSNSTGGALDGLRKGDIFYIAATAATIGRMGTLVLAKNLPDGLLELSDLDLEIFLLKDIEITENRTGFDPLTNWETNSTQITLADSITIFDSSWTDDGVELPLVVESADVYVQYRAWLPTFATDVFSIDNDEELDDVIPGVLHPDNPLKYGVFIARANSNGIDVRFSAVTDPADTDTWTTTLTKLVGKTGIYGLVPLTDNSTVITAFAAHAASESASDVGRYRVVWTYINNDEEVAKVSADTTDDDGPVLARLVDDPDTDGTQYTLLEATSDNAEFITAGVVAGDQVRFLFQTDFGVESYSTFEVDEVLTENSLRLVTGHSAAVNVAQKVEIWHPFSSTELAEDAAVKAGAFGSKFVRAVRNDRLDNVVLAGGEEVAGYFMACAWAGKRAGVAPHQSLTNSSVTGFDAYAAGTAVFNGSQLDIMGGSGTFLVIQEDTGAITCRHGLTTDMTDFNTAEEQIWANCHSLLAVLRSRLNPLKGRVNITPKTMTRIRTEIDAFHGEYQSDTLYPDLGPQLITGTLTELREGLFRGSLVIGLEWDLPEALNNIDAFITI